MKEQKGFGLVGILIIIAVLGLVSFAGWYAYNKRQSPSVSTNSSNQRNKSNQNEATSTKTKVALTTYCSKSEKACFDYPSDWKLENQFTSNGLDSGGNDVSKYDSVKVTSPKGSTIFWATFRSGLGGGCEPNANNTIFIDQSTASSFDPSVNLVRTHVGGDYNNDVSYVYGSAGRTGIPLSVGSTGGCLVYFSFPSKQLNEQNSVWLDGSVKDISEAAAVENVLKSFKYQ